MPQQGPHLGGGDGKAAPVVGAGPGLPAQAQQLLDVLDLQQDLIPQQLQLLVVVEGAGGPALPPPSLWLPFLGFALLLWRREETRRVAAG